MAKVTVNGKCSVKPGSRSAQLWEEYTLTFRKDGNFKTVEKKRKWTLWFDTEAPIVDGQWVEVTGEGSWRVTEWESPDGLKQVIDYALNDVTITAAQTPALRRDADGDLETAPF